MENLKEKLFLFTIILRALNKYGKKWWNILWTMEANNKNLE